MKTHTIALVCLALAWSGLLTAQSGLSAEKKKVVQYLESQKDHFADCAHRIWEWSELGYEEEKSSALLKDELRKAGFALNDGSDELPTDFVASFGSGKPVIAILAEFDALPGLSQAAVPYQQKREEVSAGHACGHHLFGAGSVAAAIATKKWMEETNTAGTIRLYGTPAEEGGGGKVFMVRAGLFDDVDAVLHWHPSSMNSADAGSSLAIKTGKFRFYGVAAHAAGAPWVGRSALDGVEAMNYMANLMREHVEPDSRIHYVITQGGDAPNVVPAFAEVYYYARHPDVAEVKNIFDRLIEIAEGAAKGTGTKMEYEVITGLYNLLPNETLGKMMHQNLEVVGGVSYDAEETAFAEKIMETYNARGLTPKSAENIMPFTVRERGGYASTDVGDISWVVPTAGLGAATWAPGTAAHSWQAVAAGGMSIGHKGMMVAAKTIALTAMDIFKNPNVTKEAKEELDRRCGEDFEYESLVGDRKPPLDYRQK
ncbi:amidohydrolase [Flavilitoribacter nigricans]|uniref:Amidohydrolase n=1 Tax=Flavilitoribacter nigricans (strain ATCC 23147 / DSM 23189 / NBRC 102662 / NCIMB 1420 / SS-2) TaxID=1122177 RepID=A0A2D0N449_FLAN2|nr:amidohydrolase [Flavilitoribacter nigricans]PHN03156.1 amidohydrolase [Flavilitoribacter nigricans DSM 23189 = NBRC 102662]